MRNLIVLLLLLATFTCAAQVGIGTSTPAASAVLDVKSNNKGFLPPRLTTQQIKNIASPEAGLIVYNSNANKPCYYNGTTWLFFDNTIAFPQLGVYYPAAGGIVIYLDVSEMHGLAAATADIDPVNPVPWGCPGVNIAGAQFSAIGTGQGNTNAILSACATTGIAARRCDELLLNGFSDWYLPSVAELYLVYLQKATMPAITEGEYWSSTQLSSGDANRILFSNGNIVPGNTSLGRNVRAIRTF